MKFGKNLAHLSIPEWKDYNLDYNDLKKHIRQATQTPNPDLRGLRRLFLDNFDALDLFILTKLGELARKLKSDSREFARLRASNEPVMEKLERLDSLHYRCINEVSIELRKLNKFTLVQKLAVKKIFKKFTKHYPDPAAGKQFIASLNKALHTNRASFMNFDSSELTASLLYLLLDLDHELRLLQESFQRKPQLSTPKLKKNHSALSIGTMRNSVFLGQPSPEDINLDVNFELNIDPLARFDLITLLKKNFALHSLIPRDVASRNDVNLSMDVYLSIPKVADTCRISVVFLTTGADDESPSWIILYEDLPVSTVIAFTGGLRKYSYCCLPNTVVNSIFAYLGCKDDAQRQRFGENVSAYLQDDSLLYMTKLAVSYMLQGDALPSLRLVMHRTRYLLSKGGQRVAPAPNLAKSEGLSESPESMEIPSVAPSLDDNKQYEDNYYMTLNEHIYTSCQVSDGISFEVDGMDPFPFNTFSIYSNDSNLHNFEASLTTEIQDNLLQNKYRAITLKKLPVKIQNFLKMTSVQLFKDFKLFDYMRSCYFNVIPREINNHYSRLLNVNLFKSYENFDAVNSQHDVDGSIIQDKSRIILNRQMSYKSLREDVYNENVANTESLPLLPENRQEVFYTSNNPYHDIAHEIHLQKLADLDHYDEEANEDSYIAYLGLNNELEDNVLNSVVLSFIRFKYRVKKLLNISSISHESYRHHQKNLDGRHNQEHYYDSINEDTNYFDKSNDYQERLVRDYDYVLSLLYFSLCFSSIFISGINIGILFSLVEMVNEGTQFNIMDNFLVIVLLTFGFLSSLAFTMTSINLNFQRFEPSPTSHLGIIWTGFILVILTITWSVVCIIP